MRALSPTSTALALTVALLHLPADAWSQGAATPEAAAEGLVAALREGDWDGMAERMHPAALAELRQFLEPIFRIPEAEELRTVVFGTGSEAALLEMPDGRLYADFLRFAMTQDPRLVSSLATAQVEVLGHLMEGDTAHVVSRFTMTVEGITMSRMDVSSFRQHDAQWLGLLTGDITALAAALQAAFEQAGATRQAAAEGPYDPTADAHQDIEDALRQSQGDQKLVLLDFGANWCVDCLVLDELFQDSKVAEFLQANFRVVHIDVGEFDRNLDISDTYGNPIANGVPAV
ncbi:MAG: thioredoxin family protein, partial [Armatimonadota bacterium]